MDSVDVEINKNPLFSMVKKESKKNTLTASEINLQQSSNKISNQLLLSLKSIKQTTKSLIDLDLNSEDQKLAQNLTYLEKEITRLENLIRKREYHTSNEVRGLGYLAFNDLLTELPNRQFFERVVESLISEARHKFYLLFIDIDDFKMINDTHGHEFGDRVLKSVAHRLHNSLREGDVVARYGGDEFVALIYYQDPSDLDKVMQRLLNLTQQPYQIGQNEIYVHLTFGVAAYPDHCSCYSELICKADEAMYTAKQSGKNSYQVAFNAV